MSYGRACHLVPITLFRRRRDAFIVDGNRHVSISRAVNIPHYRGDDLP